MLVRGPGVRDAVNWESRVEFWLKEIADAAVANSGGGTSPALLALVQQLAGDVADIGILLANMSQGEKPIVRSERERHDCIDFEISKDPIFALEPDATRSKVRICNNSGDASQGFPVRDPCYIVLGFDAQPPSADSWDQIILPGETAIVDAPTLQIWIATIKWDPDSIIGVFTVTQFFTE